MGEHIPSMKNNFYPHAFRFFIRENRKTQMKYKHLATDATWLPHRKPLTILWSIPEGIPSLDQTIPRCKEGIQLDDLLVKTKTGSKRMRYAQLKWWREFVEEQESVWTLWNGTSVGQHEVLKSKHWPLNTLRHSQRKTSASIGAPGPTRQDNKLQRPLKKETTIPPVGSCCFSS